jgi:hypothetical protein
MKFLECTSVPWKSSAPCAKSALLNSDIYLRVSAFCYKMSVPCASLRPHYKMKTQFAS